jgi:Antitoxin VbhA
MKALTRKAEIPSPTLAFSRECLRNALGNSALEGLRPDPVDLSDLERVMDGELSGSEYLDRIKARYAVPA